MGDIGVGNMENEGIVYQVIVVASTNRLASFARVWKEISHGAVPESEYVFYVIAIL